MTTTNNKTENLYSLSSYCYKVGDIGKEVFDLTQFFYDIKCLPDYQGEHFRPTIDSDEEMERLDEMIFTTRSIAENFIMVAPIILYRLIESYLKKHLLQIYKSKLNFYSEYKNNKDRKLKYKTAIFTANIDRIKQLYKNSEVGIELEKNSYWIVINEIRELNNCLKHNNDTVSESLWKINLDWKGVKLITSEMIQKRIPAFDDGINCFFLEIEKQAPFITNINE